MRGQSLDSIWRYPEAIEELRRLWEDGLSASSIAAVLQRYAPVSRDSVIGKAHRMRLAGRPSPIKFGAGHPRRNRARKVPMTTLAAYLKSPPAVEALPPAIVSPRTAPPVRQSAATVSLPVSSPRSGEREGDGRPCQWPMWGDERPTNVFCGQRAVTGKPYCSVHSRRACLKSATTVAA